jgi:2-dehydro-3-deoxy-D-arabinonate dehydratase
MKLFKTANGVVLVESDRRYEIRDVEWDQLFNRDDLLEYLKATLQTTMAATSSFSDREAIAPIGQQEVWAAGVTYFRSRTARIEESQAAGGGDFYDKVYTAERPELFYKSSPHRVAGTGQKVRIRSDSKWNVPEPELALAINSRGKIIGYTIGNDMSSRDIEGENPLYLPQAKVYDKSCALGPGILITDSELSASTEIKLEISRSDKTAYSGVTSLSAMKRKKQELVEYLFRDNSFPNGCFLLTGTGIVPPDSFTLQSGDTISITIEELGTLTNEVE